MIGWLVACGPSLPDWAPLDEGEVVSEREVRSVLPPEVIAVQLAGAGFHQVHPVDETLHDSFRSRWTRAGIWVDLRAREDGTKVVRAEVAALPPLDRPVWSVHSVADFGKLGHGQGVGGDVAVRHDHYLWSSGRKTERFAWSAEGETLRLDGPLGPCPDPLVFGGIRPTGLACGAETRLQRNGVGAVIEVVGDAERVAGIVGRPLEAPVGVVRIPGEASALTVRHPTGSALGRATVFRLCRDLGRCPSVVEAPGRVQVHVPVGLE